MNSPLSARPAAIPRLISSLSNLVIVHHFDHMHSLQSWHFCFVYIYVYVNGIVYILMPLKKSL